MITDSEEEGEVDGRGGRTQSDELADHDSNPVAGDGGYCPWETREFLITTRRIEDFIRRKSGWLERDGAPHCWAYEHLARNRIHFANWTECISPDLLTAVRPFMANEQGVPTDALLDLHDFLSTISSKIDSTVANSTAADTSARACDGGYLLEEVRRFLLGWFRDYQILGDEEGRDATDVDPRSIFFLFVSVVLSDFCRSLVWVERDAWPGVRGIVHLLQIDELGQSLLHRCAAGELDALRSVENLDWTGETFFRCMSWTDSDGHTPDAERLKSIFASLAGSSEGALLDHLAKSEQNHRHAARESLASSVPDASQGNDCSEEGKASQQAPSEVPLFFSDESRIPFLEFERRVKSCGNMILQSASLEKVYFLCLDSGGLQLAQWWDAVGPLRPLLDYFWGVKTDDEREQYIFKYRFDSKRLYFDFARFWRNVLEHIGDPAYRKDAAKNLQHWFATCSKFSTRCNAADVSLPHLVLLFVDEEFPQYRGFLQRLWGHWRALGIREVDKTMFVKPDTQLHRAVRASDLEQVQEFFRSHSVERDAEAILLVLRWENNFHETPVALAEYFTCPANQDGFTAEEIETHARILNLLLTKRTEASTALRTVDSFQAHARGESKISGRKRGAPARSGVGGDAESGRLAKRSRTTPDNEEEKVSALRKELADRIVAKTEKPLDARVAERLQKEDNMTYLRRLRDKEEALTAWVDSSRFHPRFSIKQERRIDI